MSLFQYTVCNGFMEPLKWNGNITIDNGLIDDIHHIGRHTMWVTWARLLYQFILDHTMFSIVVIEIILLHHLLSSGTNLDIIYSQTIQTVAVFVTYWNFQLYEKMSIPKSQPLFTLEMANSGTVCIVWLSIMLCVMVCIILYAFNV